ncbi:MAG: ACP S-malonyltransferase [Bacilli bacterium]|nr:ACP S-malonyltransferase [Bacilli bacterium]
MKKIAIMFAGQGAQVVGMGKEFYDNFETAKTLYQNASEILGYNLNKVCFEENDMINQTLYTQPAILVTSLAIYEVLKEKTNIKAEAFLGFSLGEYSALYACGIFNYKQIVELIRKRAYYMDKATYENKGSMAAIITSDKEGLESLCKKVSDKVGLVRIANYNCASQYVISGVNEAIDEVIARKEEANIKKAIKLKVSGAFHTPLMSTAALEIEKEIKKINYNAFHTPIVMNCDAQYLKMEELPLKMKAQIESSVYFEDSIKKLISEKFDLFIEIGPGQVLKNLVKKIDENVAVVSINCIEDITNLGGML